VLVVRGVEEGSEVRVKIRLSASGEVMRTKFGSN
jgi:hypothetical protein